MFRFIDFLNHVISLGGIFELSMDRSPALPLFSLGTLGKESKVVPTCTELQTAKLERLPHKMKLL